MKITVIIAMLVVCFSSTQIRAEGFKDEVIRDHIKAHLMQARICYENSLKRNPTQSGELKYQWIVGKSGKVEEIKILGSESYLKYKDIRLIRCIASRIMTWKFPKHQKNGGVEVTFPFGFSPDP